jgi:hypothetical protein
MLGAMKRNSDISRKDAKVAKEKRKEKIFAFFEKKQRKEINNAFTTSSYRCCHRYLGGGFDCRVRAIRQR